MRSRLDAYWIAAFKVEQAAGVELRK